jgi:methylthioribose-1-phosphate isomerase
MSDNGRANAASQILGHCAIGHFVTVGILGAILGNYQLLEDSKSITIYFVSTPPLSTQ